MNALVKKEIRLLLPGWLAGLLLALSVWLIPEMPEHSSLTLRLGANLAVLFFLLGPVTVMLTALKSFGGEFNSGTFSLLLAQPVSRTRLWWTKTLLLAGAILSLWLAWCICYGLREPMKEAGWASWQDVCLGTGLFALAMYSGGLWTTLLFRQMPAAFWFTLLVPAALFMTIGNLLDDYPDPTVVRVMTIVFGVYGLAGFLLARRLFLRAQDVQWAGGAITMPTMRSLKWWGERSRESKNQLDLGSLTTLPRRKCHPRTALFIKELQLHQSQFLMAGVLALLHLGVIVTRTFGHYPLNSTPRFLLDTFWLLWLVMPMLVGCAAVAEERKMGTLESQLCLPAKRRTQFVVKLFVALSLAVLLGTLMPVLLEGKRILPDLDLNASRILADVNHSGSYGTTIAGIARLTVLYILASLSPLLPFCCLAVISASVAALAFYASTLARNTLQTLGPALLGTLLTWFLLFAAVRPESFVNHPLWHGWLVYLIGVPVMVLVLATLALWNFKRVLVGWDVWRRNLLTLAISLALVVTATTALYHRAWELLTPLEPPPGAARLENSIRLRINNIGDLAVFLPDGRVWLNRYWSDQLNGDRAPTSEFYQNAFFGGGRFLDGTNWTAVADCYRDIVGLQRDGSLWVSETPARQLVHWGLGENPAPASTKLVRFGKDSDWKDVVVNFPGPFLLKTDGTLWRWGIWGTNRIRRIQNWAWPGLRASEPQRLGTNSDWSEIFSAGSRTFLRQTGGQMWAYPPYSDQNTKLALDSNVVLDRVQYTDQRNTVIVRPSDCYPFRVGIREDGTFRIVASEHWNNHSRAMHWEAIDLPIGNETNWVGVASSGGRIVTLKRDGSLWLWTFKRERWTSWEDKSALLDFKNTTPVRLGVNSDWLTVGEMMGGIVSLAADGKLWLWRFDPQYFSSGPAYPLLAVSRRPELIGNLFGPSN